MHGSLQWRHNGRDGVSNHQPHDCVLNRFFRRRSKKTSKLRVTGLCAGNSPVAGEFPTQMASNAENVFIWWHHHVEHRLGFEPTKDHLYIDYTGVCGVSLDSVLNNNGRVLITIAQCATTNNWTTILFSFSIIWCCFNLWTYIHQGCSTGMLLSQLRQKFVFKEHKDWSLSFHISMCFDHKKTAITGGITCRVFQFLNKKHWVCRGTMPTKWFLTMALQWRLNGRDGVSNYRRLDCLLSRLFRRKSKKTSKRRVTGFVRGIHRWPVTCFDVLCLPCGHI